MPHRHAVSSGEKMLIETRAKINWTLDITGVREDGYHYMDMLMQPVSLCDYVTIRDSEKIELYMTGFPRIRADESNIAMKAALLLKEKTGSSKGAAITVEKHIPVGAGMAGGSADAAAVLAGLNKAWQLGLSYGELAEIALSVGADVPFCLKGGLVRAKGIGEQIESIPCKNLYWLVVVQPCRGLSTKEIFAEWTDRGPNPPKNDMAQETLENGNIRQLTDCLGNVLQPVSEKICPEIHEAVLGLREQGAITALMTGSGSAVYGVFINAGAARKAAAVLRRRWNKTFMCHTCRESMLIDGQPV